MHRFLLALTLAAVVAGTARPSPLGAVVIDAEMKKAADEIKRRIEERPEGQRTVALSSVTCPTDLRATGGAMIAKRLADELKHRGVAFHPRPAVSIVGEYREVSGADPTTVEKAVIQLTLKDRTGKPVGEPISATVDGLEPLTLLFPGLVQPGKKGIAIDPKMTMKKTRIFGNEAGKFAVEVLVADNPSDKTKAADYKALEPKVEDGLARVEIKRTQAYAVRVHNLTGEDAAVELMIDGVSMFEFSDEKALDGSPKVKYVFLRKGSSALIRGWYLRDKTTDLFYLTDRDKSAGYSRMMLREIGTVTARFHVCWEKPGQRPKDEKDYTERDVAGTGIGLFPVEDEKRRLKVKVGVIRESIPVLYTRP
ncbi:MAG: hypothetical protein ACRC33_20275 [Gemmataceae bacterium]